MSARARRAVGAPKAEVLVSAASAWELAVKVRLGKLPDASRLTHHFAESLAEQDFRALPISLEHGRLAGLMPGDHRDPFDRVLAAQALIEDLVLVTSDPAIPAFGVKTLW